MEPQKMQRGRVGRPLNSLWGRAAAHRPPDCGAKTPGKPLALLSAPQSALDVLVQFLCRTPLFVTVRCLCRTLAVTEPSIECVSENADCIVQEDDWRARESAILALGAISEGCANGLLGHLTEMVHIMLPMLLDARPLVRSISCWALSRYSYWIVQASVELNSQGKQQFDTVVAVCLPSYATCSFCAAFLTGLVRFCNPFLCTDLLQLTVLLSMPEWG